MTPDLTGFPYSVIVYASPDTNDNASQLEIGSPHDGQAWKADASDPRLSGPQPVVSVNTIGSTVRVFGRRTR
jgi:hypothetical protein